MLSLVGNRCGGGGEPPSAMTDVADGVRLQAGSSRHELLGTCSTFPTSSQLPREGRELAGCLVVLRSCQQVGDKPRAWRRRQQGPVCCPCCTWAPCFGSCQSWFQIAAQCKLLPTASPGVECPKCRFGAAQLQRVIHHHYSCMSQGTPSPPSSEDFRVEEV